MDVQCLLNYVSVERHSYLKSVRKSFSGLICIMNDPHDLDDSGSSCQHELFYYDSIGIYGNLLHPYSNWLQIRSFKNSSLYLVFSLLSVRLIISCHSCSFQAPVGESLSYFFSNLFWFRKFVNKEVRMACKFETNIEPEWVIEAYFFK